MSSGISQYPYGRHLVTDDPLTKEEEKALYIGNRQYIYEQRPMPPKKITSLPVPVTANKCRADYGMPDDINNNKKRDL